MAWITITKRWNRKVNDLQTARFLPGRHNVTAAVAREAKDAGVVEPEKAEDGDGQDDG